jgi:mannose-6-phosphate isomerase-like protein (cupin superfamily)
MAPSRLRRDDRDPYLTKDGSTVLELVHPSFAGEVRQSLAEAVVPAGGSTTEHYHSSSEELYSFTAGSGRMRLGGGEFEVMAGDSVVIPPGVPHKLWADPAGELVVLCCSVPPYSHEDTFLTE